MELSLIAAQHFQAVSGAFMDSPCNDNSSHQTSTSNLNANFSRPAEQEEEGKFSSDAIWLVSGDTGAHHQLNFTMCLREISFCHLMLQWKQSLDYLIMETRRNMLT
nr:uncharacterized protein LOC129419138 isoform X2 [Misgurnus anguillicaudatus]